jgi:hypothetical protein
MGFRAEEVFRDAMNGTLVCVRTISIALGQACKAVLRLFLSLKEPVCDIMLLAY